MTKEETTNSIKTNRFTYFLWWCSGVVIPILEKIPSDHSKYFGIGGAIFATWTLATLSGGYALFFMLNDIPAAIIGGLMWGWVIFNLDRFITSSMKKKGDSLQPVSFFGRIGQFLSELLPALPRLFIAVIIGYSISIPLELKLFEREVNEELKLVKQAEINSQKEVMRAMVDKQIIALKKDKYQLNEEYNEIKTEQKKSKSLLYEDRDRYQNEITKAQEAINIAIKKLQAEIKGKNKTGIGCGRICKSIYRRIDTLEFRRASVEKLANKQIKNIDNNIQIILDQQNINNNDLLLKKNNINEKIKAIKTALDTENKLLKSENIKAGFLTQIKALFSIAKKPGNEAVEWAQKMLILLILLIEIGPILVKLLSSRGHYDTKMDHINFINMILLDKERRSALMGSNNERYVMDHNLSPEEIANDFILFLKNQNNNK